jgi:hypothetical protein
MKNKVVLILLLVFPIVTYLIFASAKHNAMFLPYISKANQELPQDWKSLSGDTVKLQDKITILGFLGSDIEKAKGGMFNLNQKIYNKYFGFKDFQMVMVVCDGQQAAIAEVMKKMEPLSKDLSGWKFVFASPEAIQDYYNTFHLVGNLDNQTATPSVIILDKEINHRGRKGKNKAGIEEYMESYNTISAAALHNDMSDDVKIILREYRLALKKNNKRKDEFRDKITNEVEQTIAE